MVVTAKQIQICLHFAECSFQFKILTLKHLIFPHHGSKFIFHLLKSSDPFLVYNWSININGHLNFNWHFDFNFFLNFHRPIHINRLFNEYWFVHNNWIFVDWFFYKHLLFNYLWYFNFFDDDFWYFFLYLNVLGNLHYLLYNTLGTRNVLGNLHLYFHWFLENELFHHVSGNNVVIHSRLFLEDIVLHL